MIKRYFISIEPGSFGPGICSDEDSDGDWCKWEDVRVLLERLEEGIGDEYGGWYDSFRLWLLREAR